MKANSTPPSKHSSGTTATANRAKLSKSPKSPTSPSSSLSVKTQRRLLRSATSTPKPTEEVRIERQWNDPQWAFLHATERFVNYEGGVRSGKTTAVVWKLILYAKDYPGIQMLLSRWTQDALDAIVKPIFYKECPRALLGRGPNPDPHTAANGWNSKEEYQEFVNGSRLYMRALKTSDDTARYSKISGLTLAVVAVDQPEEMPEDVYEALTFRLSQVGFPQQLLLTPNPPALDHWLVKEFPHDTALPPNHRFIKTTLYDNRAIMGDEYIAEAERKYPRGHVMRRRLIDGERGLQTIGEPVYGKVFSRVLHVKDVEFNSEWPLVESWDFGQKHPAVTWHQFSPDGFWNILGVYQGDQQFIDESVPVVAAIRSDLFGDIASLRVCCDPAGADKQGHGLRTTAVDILNQHLRMVYGPGVSAKWVVGSNRPEKREWCIQQISGYMGRLIRGRPAILVHSRCGLLIDGFEAGYVYDEHVFRTSALPNIRRVKKDGYYDHSQNTVEYAVLNYGNRFFDTPPPLSEREQLRRSQLDDRDLEQPVRRSRSGY